MAYGRRATLQLKFMRTPARTGVYARIPLLPRYLICAVLAGLLIRADTTNAQINSHSVSDTTSASTSILRGNGAPTGIQDLKVLQKRVQAIAEQAIARTVAIQVGRANGSGVIVSKSGYVLTAAHVAGEPDRKAIIVLSDGRQVKGITLGLNEVLDAGMIKITESGNWPYAELGSSTEVKMGQWCLATGHPGGYNPDRKPVLRLGRVIKVGKSALISDCTLVGGDSGGPLFDLDGKVIAIHSRIGKNLAVNVHVPVERYKKAWDRLVRGEAWDRLNPTPAQSWIGVFESANSDNRVKIERVVPNSPAELAGIQPGDVLIAFAGVDIQDFDSLRKYVQMHEPGESVKIQVSRNGDLFELELEIGSRSEREIQQ